MFVVCVGVLWCFRSCHFSHALSCFSKCLDLSPHCASFYVNRGDAYLEVGEEDHALSDYQMARKLQTNGVTTTAAAAAGGAGVRGVATKIAEIHAKRGKELFNVRGTTTRRENTHTHTRKKQRRADADGMLYLS